ncbi:FecR domain-containing protein [Pedobacter sp. KR3-3]|uniref:FecR domain-containing protein n=1 Tax=Pedobacter albus TaxID=3113905 RepID=A0ABU7I2R9_9SPHI|nr:FecR domain-containing protein [Pedobacter sp. KR3-3]MEE1943733.1 FecR domain-containing protein [Pedobacter sp. KR3-3]
MKIDQLLDRYLKGEASLEEQQLVEQWLENPDQAATVWDELGASNQDEWLQKLYCRISNTIGAENKKIIKFKSWLKVAIASAAVLAGFLLTLLLWPKQKQPVAIASWTTVSAALGEKHYVMLEDSSSVWLNGGASIRYNTAPGHKNREVYLSGEAYFDVKHLPQRPFMVHTGKITTTVLGTAFNISADKLGSQVKVAVTRGKVQVAKAGEVLGLLTPNQQIVYEQRRQSYVQSHIATEVVLDWLPDDLYFDNTTFGEAALALAKQYNVQIKFGNEKLKNCRFTGTIKKDKTLDQALRVICEFNKATYKIKNNTVAIFGAGCE